MAAVFGAIAAASGPAAADPPPIGVAAPKSTGIIAVSALGDRATVAAALASAIAKPGIVVVPDAIGAARTAASAGAVPIDDLARARHVREEIDDGWHAYLQVSIEYAAQSLAKALADGEQLVAWPGGAELCADAALRLGAVLAHQGKLDDARATWALAIALDPDRPISLAEFPPDVFEAVAAVRAQPPAAREHVRVATTPSGAAIAIDGRVRGSSPLAVDVSAGPHVVAARFPDRAPRAEPFVVAAGSDASLQLELADDPRAAALAQGAALGASSDHVQALVDAAMLYAQVDEIAIVAAVVRHGSPTLIVQRCAGAPAHCSPEQEIGFADSSGLAAAARSAWASALASPLTRAPAVLTDVGETAAPPPELCGACRSPLLWGGATVGIVLGAIAIYAETVQRSPPTVIVRGGDFGGR